MGYSENTAESSRPLLSSQDGVSDPSIAPSAPSAEAVGYSYPREQAPSSGTGYLQQADAPPPSGPGYLQHADAPPPESQQHTSGSSSRGAPQQQQQMLPYMYGQQLPQQFHFPQAAAPPRSHITDQPLCSECGHQGSPVVRKEAGFVTWFSAITLCLGGCWFAALFPFCSDCLADTVQRCANCGSVQARRHA